MRIAILMTNTDETDFANCWPLDGVKFTTLFTTVRPDWNYDVYAVKDGLFPDDLSGIDGVVITGSPASVHDDMPWIDQLFALIRELYAQKIPMFGACFGHQAIALALGGNVEKNPDGWVFGQVETTLVNGAKWAPKGQSSLSLYAAHVEQVTRLPKGAGIISHTPGCPISGFAIGDKVLTTQYHPEMSAEFISALIEEHSEPMGEEVTARAKGSLMGNDDGEEIAKWAVRFFDPS